MRKRCGISILVIRWILWLLINENSWKLISIKQSTWTFDILSQHLLIKSLSRYQILFNDHLRLSINVVLQFTFWWIFFKLCWKLTPSHRIKIFLWLIDLRLLLLFDCTLFQLFIWRLSFFSSKLWFGSNIFFMAIIFIDLSFDITCFSNNYS